MTDVSALAGATTSAAATPTDSRQALATNFDTFLKLLTAQLQNQDPLDPVDSAKFTEQLVQYSQVEQQINTNDKLDALAAQLKTSAAGAAVSYLGHMATFNSDAAGLTDSGASWQYALGGDALATTLTVTDGAGNVVYQTSGETSAGAHAFTWDGSKIGGGRAANGVYHLKISSKGGDGSDIAAQVAVSEKIDGVDLSGNTPNVTTAAGSRALDSILRIASN
jgi:flagellar basal-body rod modification protein FlgD